MSMQVAKGSFSFPNVTDNLAVTGLAFQPKAVLFWLTKQTATGYAVNKALSVGWAVSASQRGCLAVFSADAQTAAGAVGSRIYDTRCIGAVECAAGAVTESNTGISADFVSMNADGFTIDPTTFAAGREYIVHYLAVGGSDVTNAYAGTFNTPIAAGNQSYEGVGFVPDCLLVLANANGLIPRDDTSHKLSLGAATGAADQAVAFFEESNAVPTSCYSIQKSGEVLHTLNLGGTDNTVASLVSFDTDGFTLSFSTAQSTPRGFLALALKGGRYKVVTDTQKTSTGTKAKSGLGLTPAGLLVWGTNRASSTSADGTLASLSIGASDGTTEGASWVASTDNVSTTDENSATVTDKILRHATNPSTTDAEADLSSFDSDGYTLDWTTADATAREFVALAVGPTAGAGGGTARNMMLLGVG